MKTVLIAAVLALVSTAAFAADTCVSTAVDKNGKPLVGVVKTNFMKKCTDLATEKCNAAAVDKNGKPLAGAAKDANIKKCMKDAVGE